MTAENIFDRAVVLMFGEAADKPDYQPFWIETLNFMIAENHKSNNALRMMRGKDALAEMPTVAALGDTVDMEDEYTQHILPIGCAGYIYTDDDKGVGAAYKDKYEYERTKAAGAAYEDITDVYE